MMTPDYTAIDTAVSSATTPQDERVRICVASDALPIGDEVRSMDEHELIKSLREILSKNEADDRKYFAIMLAVMVGCFILGILIGQKWGI